MFSSQQVFSSNSSRHSAAAAAATGVHIAPDTYLGEGRVDEVREEGLEANVSEPREREPLVPLVVAVVDELWSSRLKFGLKSSPHSPRANPALTAYPRNTHHNHHSQTAEKGVRR
jgi:hypothetical protein